jgi:hypothetical protein
MTNEEAGSTPLKKNLATRRRTAQSNQAHFFILPLFYKDILKMSLYPCILQPINFELTGYHGTVKEPHALEGIPSLTQFFNSLPRSREAG